MIRIFFSILILLCMGCAITSLENTPVIHIEGSDTMLLLTSRWAEEYMKIRPNVAVYAEGGGSAVGMRSLINGEIDICASSRPIRPQETRLLADNYGTLGMRFLVAKDALSVYIHPDNPVKNLTVAQLKGIFTGAITSWKEVGGFDLAIRVISRSPNSGTYLYFHEHILDGESYAASSEIKSTTSSIVKTVSEAVTAIGYGGIAYGRHLFHCKINGITPSDKNVRNDTYPIIRYLYLYTIDTPRGHIKEFIDWVVKDGQKIVHSIGYFPLWEINP
jgi:phosphate transport system substrate-binding protein